MESDSGQGHAEYVLTLGLFLIICLGLFGALDLWSRAGAVGGLLANRAPHSVTPEGGVPTWIGDTAAH